MGHPVEIKFNSKHSGGSGLKDHCNSIETEFSSLSGFGGSWCDIRKWHDRGGSTDKTILCAWTRQAYTWREESGKTQRALSPINLSNRRAMVKWGNTFPLDQALHSRPNYPPPSPFYASHAGYLMVSVLDSGLSCPGSSSLGLGDGLLITVLCFWVWYRV